MKYRFKNGSDISNEIYIGVDPGKTGAFCLLDDDNNFELFAFEKIERWKNVYDLFKWHKVKLCVLEKAQAMPKQGVKSMFTYGGNFGGWQTALDIADISNQLISPQQWQKSILQGTNRGDKMAGINFCNKMFPTQKFLKAHHNFVDALLIAMYARRLYRDM